MEFDEYQYRASVTAKYPDEEDVWGVIYTAMGLAGEAGEVANKVKKIMRDDNWKITPERMAAILDELGDVLWYASELASCLGVSFSFVAEQNIDKLSRREDEGTVHGDGDNR